MLRLNLIGEPDVPAAVLVDFLKTKCTHPELEFLVKTYYDVTRELARRPSYPRLNPVPSILQAMLETGFLTSWWFVQNGNLAGLGVTGPDNDRAGSPNKKPAPVMGTDWVYNPAVGKWQQGLIFFSIESAVRAHLYHVLAYCNPSVNYGPVADFFNNRYYLALGTRASKLAARLLTDYNQAWAKPGYDYGQRIEAIWNDFDRWADQKLKGG